MQLLTPTDPLTLDPLSFFRPPSWRWERTVWLCQTARRTDPRVDDEWVVAAHAVLSDQLSASRRVVEAARDIWTGELAVRHELEAWLLADVPLAEVAGRTGMPADLVTAYEALFFAVREVRTATDWLLLRAVGYSATRAFMADLPYAAWKYAALLGGPAALEVVMAATTGTPLPAGVVRSTGENRSVAEARLRLKVKLWIALLAASTPAELARATHALRQLREQQAGETDQPATVTPGQHAAEEFLLSLPALTRRPKGTVAPNVQTPRRRRTKR